MTRPVQYFSSEYLAHRRGMSAEQIVRFLDDFRRLQASPKPPKSRLISLKVPEPLLEDFKLAATANGTPYQTQIKRLMSEWLTSLADRAPAPPAPRRK